MKAQEIKLGDKLRDIVTGIEGVCIGKTSWITGCDHAHLQYLNKDGNLIQESFDVTRIEYINSDVYNKMNPPQQSVQPDEPEKEKGGPPQRAVKL